MESRKVVQMNLLLRKMEMQMERTYLWTQQEMESVEQIEKLALTHTHYDV